MPPTALVLVLTPGHAPDVALLPEIADWCERQPLAPDVVLVTEGPTSHLRALAEEYGLGFAEVRPAIEPHAAPCAVVIDADGGVGDAVRGHAAVRALLRGLPVHA
jgi:hypothetical protein